MPYTLSQWSYFHLEICQCVIQTNSSINAQCKWDIWVHFWLSYSSLRPTGCGFIIIELLCAYKRSNIRSDSENNLHWSFMRRDVDLDTVTLVSSGTLHSISLKLLWLLVLHTSIMEFGSCPQQSRDEVQSTTAICHYNVIPYMFPAWLIIIKLSLHQHNQDHAWQRQDCNSTPYRTRLNNNQKTK